MQQKSIIETTHLFMPIHDALIQVLKELEPSDWNKSTLAKHWSIKDIVAHILDTTTRGIAILRDGHFGESGPADEAYATLVDYINQMNAEFIRTAKRWSPQVLIELLEQSGPIHAKLLADLDPFQKAIFSVAWAGEKESYNWFHVAREYTEKFHHQLQIRAAVNKTTAIMKPELYRPFIQTFFLGLPHLLRNHTAPDFAIIAVEIKGEMGLIQYLQYYHQQWNLLNESPGDKLYAKTIIPADIAWKLFTKGVTPKTILSEVVLEGNQEIAFQVLHLVAVMA
jgi:Mycothiol maleylpyruvate isomerase N-terminal domain